MESVDVADVVDVIAAAAVVVGVDIAAVVDNGMQHKHSSYRSAVVDGCFVESFAGCKGAAAGFG